MSEDFITHSKKQFATLYWGAFLFGALSGSTIGIGTYAKFHENEKQITKAYVDKQDNTSTFIKTIAPK